MSNPEDVMGELNSLMSKAMGAQLVQDVVHAYDAYATAAMQACIRLRGTELSATQIAECAWDFADKMMAERKKRGIGGLTTPQESQPACSVCGKPATWIAPSSNRALCQTCT